MKDVMLLTFIQAGCAQPSGGFGECYRRERHNLFKKDLTWLQIKG